MKKIILLAALLLLPTLVMAADATIKLPGVNGADAFVVQDKYGSALMQVDSYGRVGIGTIAPVYGLHVLYNGGMASNGWALRAESTLNSGAVLLGSRLANTGAIQGISANGIVAPLILNPDSGNVGIGTNTPTRKLDVRGHLVLNTDGSSPFEAGGELVLANGDPLTTPTWHIDQIPGNIFRIFHQPNINTGAIGTEVLIATVSGNVGIGSIIPTFPLHMASGAHVTAGGVWTNASSRDLKENIKPITVMEAMDTLNGLSPMTYNYKVDASEQYAGFIAEDVPALVATNDRKSLAAMDVVAVLTKVVQEQQSKILTLENYKAAQDKRIAALESRMEMMARAIIGNRVAMVANSTSE